MKGDITFSPVSQSEQITLTRKQLKTLLRLAKATPAAIEVVGHNPSTTVEVYEDPVEPSTIARRHHLSADGTYDTEQCEVPQDDGDWDWEPEPTPDWVVRATRFTTPPPAKVKKPKKQYLSDKFTVRDNPNPVWDQQFQHEEVKELDCTIDLGTRQWVTMAPDVEGPRREAEDDTEYTQRRELLAEFLCNMVYGDGAWGEAGEDTRLNYRLDAQDIIKANPHLLSLEERERLGDSIPELAYDGKEESNEG